MVKGDEMPVDERDAWEWLRNPLPPGDEDPTFASLRLQLGIPDNVFFTDKGFGSLGYSSSTVVQTLAPGFYRDTTRSSATRSFAAAGRSKRLACWRRSRWTSIPDPKARRTLSLESVSGLGLAYQSSLSTSPIKQRKTLPTPCSNVPRRQGS